MTSIGSIIMTRNVHTLILALTGIVAFALGSHVQAGTFTWTEAVDSDLFNADNWDPAGLVIEPAVPVNNDLIIDSGTAAVDAAGFSAPLDLGVDGAGSLTITGGLLDMLRDAGANGVRAEGAPAGPLPSPFLISGAGAAELQFILDISMTLTDSAVMTFGGGGNPVNRSTIDFTSFDALLNFTAETPDQFINEHLSKITVNGAPAVVGANLSVIPFNGEAGSQVQALAIPEPSTAVLLAVGLLSLAGLVASRRT